MDVSQLVQLVNACEHLCCVESCMLLFQNARVVEQSPEVSSGHILLRVESRLQGDSAMMDETYHCQVDVLLILEGVEQPHEPRSLDSRQNVPLHKHMLDLVHLGQRTFAHLLQRADFVGIRLPRQVDRSISTLTDLGDDPEVLDAELGTSFSEENALSAIVRCKLLVVFLPGHLCQCTSQHESAFFWQQEG